MALVAVKGCQLTVQLPSAGNAEIDEGQEASDVEIEGNGAYFGTLKITLSGCSTTGAVKGAGTGTITGTGRHFANSELPALVVGDTATVKVTGETTSSPPSETSWDVVVKVTEAGQTTVDIT